MTDFDGLFASHVFLSTNVLIVVTDATPFVDDLFRRTCAKVPSRDVSKMVKSMIVVGGDRVGSTRLRMSCSGIAYGVNKIGILRKQVHEHE